jgi:arabinose-5-phosphate isomerase
MGTQNLCSKEQKLKKKGQYTVISGRIVIEREAQALTQLAHNFPETFSQAIQHLRSIPGKVVCTGVGKSGYVARKIASTFSSTGTPAFFIHPIEAIHGELGALSSQDALLIFSNSGESSELVQFVHHSCAAVRIVITSNPKSSLAFCADVILNFPPVSEACHLGLAPTSSSIVMMSLGDALAIVLSSLKGVQHPQYHRLHPAGSLGKQFLAVEQVMQTPAPLLSSRASAKEIIQAMISHGVGCIGLIDETGKVLGQIKSHHLSHLLENNTSFPLDDPVIVSQSLHLSEALSIMESQESQLAFVQNPVTQKIVGFLQKKEALKVDSSHA